jgi:aminoglycoside 3-N-acetyltransferase
MNIRRNDVVMVHTSLHNLKHSDFQPEDLIYLLKMIVGTEGTLLMPVSDKINLTQINTQDQYDNDNSIPCNDLITDVFQQMSDTITGNFPGYTLAVWGKQANFLTEAYNKAESSLDNVSPGYKLTQLKAKFIGFGVPNKELSFLNFINHTGIKSAAFKDSVKFNYDSFEFLKEHFEEKEIKIIEKRGISYFRVNIQRN